MDEEKEEINLIQQRGREREKRLQDYFERKHRSHETVKEEENE